MSWPLGYGNPRLVFCATLHGGLDANAIRLTDPRGWIDVPLPTGAVARGAPPMLSLRLRAERDGAGDTLLFAEEVLARGRQVAGVEALLVEGAASWLAHLLPAVHAEIARRVQAGTRPTTRATRSTMAPTSLPKG